MQARFSGIFAIQSSSRPYAIPAAKLETVVAAAESRKKAIENLPDDMRLQYSQDWQHDAIYFVKREGLKRDHEETYYPPYFSVAEETMGGITNDKKLPFADFLDLVIQAGKDRVAEDARYKAMIGEASEIARDILPNVTMNPYICKTVGIDGMRERRAIIEKNREAFERLPEGVKIDFGVDYGDSEREVIYLGFRPNDAEKSEYLFSGHSMQTYANGYRQFSMISREDQKPELAAFTLRGVGRFLMNRVRYAFQKPESFESLLHRALAKAHASHQARLDHAQLIEDSKPLIGAILPTVQLEQTVAEVFGLKHLQDVRHALLDSPAIKNLPQGVELNYKVEKEYHPTRYMERIEILKRHPEGYTGNYYVSGSDLHPQVDRDKESIGEFIENAVAHAIFLSETETGIASKKLSLTERAAALADGEAPNLTILEE